MSVGCHHDTPAFAVASIRHWWKAMGRRAYPQARRLFITANWRGRPLVTLETMIELIGNTRTYRVKAKLDDGIYPDKIKISKHDLRRMEL